MNKKIVILGAGESGVGAAVLGIKQGYDVFVSDNNIIKENYKSILKDYHINYEENKHTYSEILKADEIIKSPGIPDNTDVIKTIKQNNIPIISEIEFAYRFAMGKIIGITGSNGKTTTSFLLYHILKKSKLDVQLAGNMGKSFAMQLAQKDSKYWVLEISSFQLDDIKAFKADIAILLNITPDHLDRYDNSFEKYAQSKFKIINNQTSEDVFIYCLDDNTITKQLEQHSIKTRTYPFSISKKISDNGAYLDENKLIIIVNNNKFNIMIEQLALQGKHNIYNSMAAAISARILEISDEILKESLSNFDNIEHRLEFVASVHGIDFINDSKATNVNSTWYALESFNRPIIWIAGGIDKGNDYKFLNEIVKRKVKGIVCLGEDNTKIIKAFIKKVPFIADTKTMQDAVNAAYYFGEPGDVVLLSPACASFDLFENFEDRGIQFKNAVREL